MHDRLIVGALLAVLSGVMNGTFTLPMRFLGRWSWENVWSVFIVDACLILPAVILSVTATNSWNLLLHAPHRAVLTALAGGFAWGFGAIMFGQSVSAIGIALSNTFVLAISSAFGSVIPMIFLFPGKLHQRSGQYVLAGIAIEITGIALCGRAGLLRERASFSSDDQRGDLVGTAKPLWIALLLVTGSGLLSAVFNIAFAVSKPVSDFGQENGLSVFASTNLIWVLMLAAGAISNLAFCLFLAWKNHSFSKFAQSGSYRLYLLGAIMAILWGGSIFVYGAAVPRLGPLGPSIGWPLSLATGLLVANVVGLVLGEWRGAPRRAFAYMGPGIVVLLLAVVVLSRAN